MVCLDGHLTKAVAAAAVGVLLDSLLEGDHVAELDVNVLGVGGQVEVQEMFALVLDLADLIVLVVAHSHVTVGRVRFGLEGVALLFVVVEALDLG